MFCTAYAYTCKKAIDVKSDVIRLGIAGSLAQMACDCSFHIVDTLNIRMKIPENTASKSTFDSVRNIYAREGAYGFGRGFSACFYGSILCGLIYFYMYKSIKLKLYEQFGTSISPTAVFFISSFVAECITILGIFPYDLIKCRL